MDDIPQQTPGQPQAPAPAPSPLPPQASGPAAPQQAPDRSIPPTNYTTFDTQEKAIAAGASIDTSQAELVSDNNGDNGAQRWAWIPKGGFGSAGKDTADAIDGVMDQARDIARGAVHGIIQGIHETSKSVDSVATYATKALKGAGLPDVVYDPENGLHIDHSDQDQSEGQAVTPEDSLYNPETLLGRMSGGVAQFITGMSIFGRVGKAASFMDGTHAAGELTKSALSNAFSFDTADGNLADALKSYPSLQGPVTSFLQSDPNDTEALARFKRGMEGLGLGAIGESLFGAIRTYKAWKAGDPAAALAASEDTTKALNTPPANEPSVTNPDATGQGATPMMPVDAGNGQVNTPREKPVPAMPKGVETGPVDVDAYREKLATGQDWVANGGALPSDVPLRYQGNLDVGTAINTLHDMMGQTTPGALDGVRSLKEVRARANMIASNAGVDRDQLMAWAAQDAKDMRGLDSRLTAYNDLYVSQASRVSKLADAISEQRPGEFDTMDQLYAEFGKQLQDFNQIRTYVKSIGSENARAMGAQRAINKLKVTENYGGIGGSNDELQRIANSISMVNKDPNASASAIRQAIEPTIVGKAGEFANAWLINSILSMGTVGVKASTDLAMLAIRPAEQMIAGAMRLDPSAVRAGISMYGSYGRFLFDSLKMAGKAFNLGGQITDAAHGHTLPEGLGDGTIFNNLVNGNQGYALVNGLVKYTTLPVRVIGTNDEFTKSLMYRAEIARKASLEGADSAQRLQEAFDANGHPTDEAAWLEAQKAAMAQPPVRGQENLWWGSNSATAGVMDLANSVPVVRQVQPFIKVLGNIGRYSWRHTPGLNMLQRQYVNDLMAGGEKGSLAMAEMTTGAAMWSAGVYMANSGMIVGTLHPDPVIQKQIEDLTGQRHNSFVYTKADGTREYIPLGQISDPIGPMLAAAADFAKVSHYLSDGDVKSFAIAASITAANALKDKRYLQGFTDFTNAAATILNPDEQGAGRAAGVRYLSQRLASFMVPSMLANKRGDDPYMREIRGYLDGTLAKLPGSPGVDPARNVLGEPVPVTAAIGPKDLSPFQRSSNDMDPVNAELGRQLGQDNKPLPKLPKQLTLANGKSVDLTTIKGDNGLTAYDRMQEIMSEPQGARPGLRGALTDLFNSDAYANASDGQSQYPGSRQFMVMRTIGAYHQMAQKQLLKESMASPTSALGQIATSAKADAENKQAALRGMPLPHPELAKRNAFKEAIMQPQTAQ